MGTDDEELFLKALRSGLEAATHLLRQLKTSFDSSFVLLFIF